MYLSVDKEHNAIYIKNDIINCNDFIVLDETEVDALLEHKDKLFARYYVYLKYHIIKSKRKSTNNTIKQFLADAGYSINSNAYISKVSSYNTFIKDKGLLNITSYIDENGNYRNLFWLN